MIRWSEEQDCYRLAVSHSLQAGCMFILAAILSLMIFLVVWIVATKASADPRVIVVLVLVTLVIDGAIFFSARSYSKQHGFVEIWIRGSRARWSERPRIEMEYLEVDRFERVQGRWGGLGVEAVLPDGTRRRVFGLWKAMESRQFDKVLGQLNENLGEPPVR